jgi:simple sugar transport system permease protein
MSGIWSADFAAQSVRNALPLAAAAIGGIWSERAGIVNVALEGTILVSALGTIAFTLSTGSPVLGLAGGLLCGVVLQVLHGVVVILGKANAVVSGLALNLLAAGGTRVLLRALYDSSSNSPSLPEPTGSVVRRSVALGTALDPMTWLVAIVAVGSIVAIARTPLGLRIRAVGERPEAAASVGVDVRRTRFVALVLCGVATGMAGAWLALDQHQFSSNISAGNGFLALAIVILSGWRAGPALAYALVLGVARAAQDVLQDRQLAPYQLVEALPFLVTLLCLAGLVRRSRPPAALGQS